MAKPRRMRSHRSAGGCNGATARDGGLGRRDRRQRAAGDHRRCGRFRRLGGRDGGRRGAAGSRCRWRGATAQPEQQEKACDVKQFHLNSFFHCRSVAQTATSILAGRAIHGRASCTAPRRTQAQAWRDPHFWITAAGLRFRGAQFCAALPMRDGPIIVAFRWTGNRQSNECVRMCTPGFAGRQGFPENPLGPCAAGRAAAAPRSAPPGFWPGWWRTTRIASSCNPSRCKQASTGCASPGSTASGPTPVMQHPQVIVLEGRQRD